MNKFTKLMLAAGLCASLFGCGSNEPEVVEPEYEIIGSESEEALSTIVKNGTNQNITSISIRESANDEYSSNMMKEDDVFEVGEESKLFYNSEYDDEPVMMSITFEDGTTVELSYFTFKPEKVEIKYEDDLAYLEFEEDGNTINTKTIEWSYEDLIEEPKEVQEEVVPEPVYEEPVYVEQPVYVPEAPAQGSEGCLGDVALN